MKESNTIKKTNLFKKIFIIICRLFGYEIIDQNKYEIPTLNKNLSDSTSIPGKKSITVPLGEIKISRKIESLKIIFRSCTKELIMDQNKKRLFDKDKNEYTFRSLKSLLNSLEIAKKNFKNINYQILVTDTNSKKEDLSIIKSILSKYNIDNKIIEIDLNYFKNKIVGEYTPAKFANMANLYTSLEIVKNESCDLVYLVEDDYIHSKEAINEMLFSFEKFSTIFAEDVFLLPADYPYLYNKNEPTKIFLGNQKHWRLVEESLVTFLTSKKIIVKNFENLMQMATKWEDPWEKPLHSIYKKIPCLSPVPSLSMHCANINSVYGLPPNLDWKKIWEENQNY
tara:strand:- start:225 stop:1241 length:1017 start_codon:yes stop_codon:yes gene_type:complete